MTSPSQGSGRLLFSAGALLGATAVLLGAFGAHALNDLLEPRLMGAYQKAVDYQALHALALLFIGQLLQTRPNPWLMRAGWLMLSGTLLFSGSLYALALSGYRPLGMITPFGGTAFVLGWLCLLKAWPTNGCNQG